MKSGSSSLRWLTGALLVPLLVLSVLAWLGTQAQVRAAWESARDEARVVAGVAAAALATELGQSVEAVKIYPDPPVPGMMSAADAVLAEHDLSALRKLRNDEAAGVSPAGLPRRVLAGLRVYEMTGEKADGDALLGLATQDAPSVITSRVLEKVGGLADEMRPQWQRDERARAIFRKLGDGGGSGKWVSESDGTWWLAAQEDGMRVISPEATAACLTKAGRLLPGWAELRFSEVEKMGGERLAVGNRRHEGEELATAAVAFGNGGDLEIVAARPGLIEAAARQQARWTLGLLAVAVAISGTALGMIHRTVARERRLNALKSDFVASVSHELRAPVASIRLMADALGAGKLEPRAVAEFHDLISREGARLSALIENVLDFARIEQGRKRWDFEPTELAPLLRESLDLMGPLAAEKGMRLVAEEPLPALVAVVDAGAIRQALVNLLDNAIKFSPHGSAVKVGLAERDGAWFLTVSDEGPGIPLSERGKVFERFHRLGGELRRETQGTGIGLSLVKAVAEAHGGRVELTCGPAAGSVFTLIGPASPISP